MGDYHFLAAEGRNIGALMRGQAPRWLYYIGVEDIDVAMARITAGGGQVLEGPHEIPGGEYSLHARDPQGATFGLVGPRVATKSS
jgi:predicted enzyme related to lactoylglutathione lyase